VLKKTKLFAVVGISFTLPHREKKKTKKKGRAAKKSGRAYLSNKSRYSTGLVNVLKVMPESIVSADSEPMHIVEVEILT
jgi:hypothetical protein